MAHILWSSILLHRRLEKIDNSEKVRIFAVTGRINALIHEKIHGNFIFFQEKSPCNFTPRDVY